MWFSLEFLIGAPMFFFQFLGVSRKSGKELLKHVIRRTLIGCLSRTSISFCRGGHFGKRLWRGRLLSRFSPYVCVSVAFSTPLVTPERPYFEAQIAFLGLDTVNLSLLRRLGEPRFSRLLAFVSMMADSPLQVLLISGSFSYSVEAKVTLRDPLSLFMTKSPEMG